MISKIASERSRLHEGGTDLWWQVIVTDAALQSHGVIVAWSVIQLIVIHLELRILQDLFAILTPKTLCIMLCMSTHAWITLKSIDLFYKIHICFVPGYSKVFSPINLRNMHESHTHTGKLPLLYSLCLIAWMRTSHFLFWIPDIILGSSCLALLQKNWVVQ